jgi:simple sugar transport system permease protein
MTTPQLSARLRPVLTRLPGKQLPVLVTLALFGLMYGIGALRYEGFSDTQVFLNLFIDNGFLLIVAVGMTFVILTGGIDLSVGSVVGLSTMLSATMLKDDGWPLPVVVLTVMAIGSVLGFVMGCIIHFFEIQPFIVTLAGMFLGRGLCYVISTDSIPIRNETWISIADTRIPLGNYHVSPSAIVAIVVVLIAVWALSYTKLGRNVYAIGGSPQSALLMGLPVGRTTIAVYTISGFCSALGGMVYTFYTLSGAPLAGMSLELDAIAAVVIGGTLLTGGSGFLLGTVVGVLVLGLIQSYIAFDGRLSTWWTKIAIGILLFAFILLQRVSRYRRS